MRDNHYFFNAAYSCWYAAIRFGMGWKRDESLNSPPPSNSTPNTVSIFILLCETANVDDDGDDGNGNSNGNNNSN